MITAWVYPIKFNDLPRLRDIFQIVNIFLIVSVIFTFLWGIGQGHIYLIARSYWDYWKSLAIYLIILCLLLLNSVAFFFTLGDRMVRIQKQPFDNFSETYQNFKKYKYLFNDNSRQVWIPHKEKASMDRELHNVFADDYVIEWDSAKSYKTYDFYTQDSCCLINTTYKYDSLFNQFTQVDTVCYDTADLMYYDLRFYPKEYMVEELVQQDKDVFIEQNKKREYNQLSSREVNELLTFIDHYADSAKQIINMHEERIMPMIKSAFPGLKDLSYQEIYAQYERFSKRTQKLKDTYSRDLYILQNSFAYDTDLVEAKSKDLAQFSDIMTFVYGNYKSPDLAIKRRWSSSYDYLYNEYTPTYNDDGTIVHREPRSTLKEFESQVYLDSNMNIKNFFEYGFQQYLEDLVDITKERDALIQTQQQNFLKSPRIVNLGIFSGDTKKKTQALRWSLQSVVEEHYPTFNDVQYYQDRLAKKNEISQYERREAEEMIERLLDRKEEYRKYYARYKFLHDSIEQVTERNEKDWYNTVAKRDADIDNRIQNLQAYLSERQKLEEEGFEVIFFVDLISRLEKDLMSFLSKDARLYFEDKIGRIVEESSPSILIQDYHLIPFFYRSLEQKGKAKFLGKFYDEVNLLDAELNNTVSNTLLAGNFNVSENEAAKNQVNEIAEVYIILFPILAIILLLFSVFPIQVFVNTLFGTILFGIISAFAWNLLSPYVPSVDFLRSSSENVLYIGLLLSYLCVLGYLSYRYFRKKSDKTFNKFLITFIIINSPLFIFFLNLTVDNINEGSSLYVIREAFSNGGIWYVWGTGMLLLNGLAFWFLYRYQSRPKVT